MVAMNTNNSHAFKRGLILVLSLLFILTLGVLVVMPALFTGEEFELWMLLVNTVLLAIPTGLFYGLAGILIMTIYRHQHHEQLNQRLASFIYWGPRVGCILLVAFMSLFALDVFEAGIPLSEMLLGFLMHMLPMIGLAVVLAIAWRLPWFGAGFFGLATVAFLMPTILGGAQGLPAFFTFGMPLLLIALLFGINAHWKQEIEQARHPTLQTA
jgi:hypothetical protein